MSDSYLIIEAGSTKTDWVLCQSGKIIQHYKGIGINPTTSRIHTVLVEESALISAADRVYYYGSGINNEASKALIRTFLAYPEKVRSVENDVMAVVNSQTPSEDAIVGILGTGSVAFLWQDGQLIEGCPSLGFILSDEGAGSHIGRSIIKSYFYKTMPDEVRNHFEALYPKLDKFSFLRKLYQDKKQAAYLASFTTFLSTLSKNEWKDQLLADCFTDFLNIRVKYFEESQVLPIYLSGSISEIFKNEIKAVFSDYLSESQGIYVCKSPLSGLIEYHSKH